MVNCSISWLPIKKGELFSKIGLRKLNSSLDTFKPLKYSSEQLRLEAVKRADKMSIQGVQPKLSAVLNVKRGGFDLVDRGGRYILKPAHILYPEVPENEALTMSLACDFGLDTPLHGFLKCSDNSNVYFIKRFDRKGQKGKVNQEDFAQLTGKNRDTKYSSSMEKVIEVVNQYCSFPAIERVKLFKRVLFCFLTGNEDMHLKNFSIIIKNRKVMLSPVYDLLNTTIILPKVIEELALPIRGKRRKITYDDIVLYFGGERCELQQKTIDRVLKECADCLPVWKHKIQNSYLSNDFKNKYLDLLLERSQRLKIV